MNLYEAQGLCDIVLRESTLKARCKQIGNGEFVVILHCAGEAGMDFYIWSPDDWQVQKLQWPHRLFGEEYRV